ncbi:MAG TPA: sigma-70 family RNA polymerase sigma factor [Thermoanaerobaculia bacterium]|jgi:RNA polymerase sigma factor (sigma-70 family)|nr:sigma-70 family RNA polymerase sigma factor [Thermoanaerobaculia bacterium]
MTVALMRADDTTTGRLVEALERSRSRLKWILARFRLSKEEAEDLLQDMAVAAIQKLPEIQNLDGWLVGVAFRMCAYRARRDRSGPQFTPLGDFDMAVSPEQGRRDLAVDLERALASLPRRHRGIFVLRAMGFSESEVAVRTGYSPKSLRGVRYRLRARIAVQLAARYEPSGNKAA